MTVISMTISNITNPTPTLPPPSFLPLCPAHDTEYYYTRIALSDPSSRADRFGLRLSSHAKATALYILARNRVYPTTLQVAVQYREGIRRAVGLVLDVPGGEGKGGISSSHGFMAAITGVRLISRRKRKFLIWSSLIN